jgi:hypothetical protein
MKATDEFKFSQEWWKKNKPLTLKSTGLGEVLKKYDGLTATIDKMIAGSNYQGVDPAKDPFDAAVAMVKKDIDKAVENALKDCNKTLHKDCIAVLEKYSTTAQKEAARILRTKANFESVYAKYVKDMGELAQVKFDHISAEKDRGHKLLKTSESDAQQIQTVVDKVVQSQKAGKGTPKILGALIRLAEKHLHDMETHLDDLKNLSTDIAKVFSAMGSPLITDEMLNPDKEKRIVLENKAQLMRNNITEYVNKVQTLLRGAENNVKDLKSIQDKTPVSLESMQARADNAADAINELQEDARRHSNVFTGWLLNLRSMQKARAAATNGKTIEEAAKENAIVTAPGDWKARATEWAVEGAKIKKKVGKLLPQAKTLFDQLEERVPQDMRTDPIIKEKWEEMQAAIDKITDYIGNIDTWQGQVIKGASEL